MNRIAQPPLAGVSSRRQRGSALMMMMLTLVAVGSAVLLDRLQASAPSRLRTANAKVSIDALSTAKSALIGWAITHPNKLGGLPFPDRNADGNYDGEADCPATSVTSTSLLFGRFPYKGNAVPCNKVELSAYVTDGAGEQLWYAVSENILSDKNDSVFINPGLVESVSNPWLTVRDATGAPLTDDNGDKLKIAAVLIAPGRAFAGQDRSAAAPAASAYLDSITIASGANAGTYSNSDDDLDFIMYTDSDLTESVDDEFNDRLVYITVDELLSLVERSVLGEIANWLETYQVQVGNPRGLLPWLSPFDDPNSTGFDAAVGTRKGQIPRTVIPEEIIAAPFTVHSWDLCLSVAGSCTSGLSVSGTGGTGDPPTPTDDAMYYGPRLADPENPGQWINISVNFNDPNTECEWVDPTTIACEGKHEQVWTDYTYTPLNPQTTPSDYPKYLRTIQVSELFSAGGSLSITPPSASDFRQRVVSTTDSAVHNGLSGVSEKRIEIKIRNQRKLCGFSLPLCDWENSSWRTITSGLGNHGSISVETRFPLDNSYDNYPVTTLVTNQWREYIYAAFSSALVGGGSGTCLAGADCLSLTKVDNRGNSSTDDEVAAMLLSSGQELAINERVNGHPVEPFENCPAPPAVTVSLSGPLCTCTGDFLCEYFDLVNSDHNGEEYVLNDAYRTGAYSSDFNDKAVAFGK